MDAPRFTTYADLNALREFFLAEPPATQPQPKRDWSEAWGFLATETDLAFDVPADDLDRRLRDGDPLMATLFQAGTMRRFGSDTAPEIRHPWRLHLGTALEPGGAVLKVSPSSAAADLKRIRSPRGVALRKGHRNIEQALQGLQAPTCGAVVVDPYLLATGEEGLRRSVAPIVASLVPPSAREIPILILCGTVPRRGRTVLPGPCPKLDEQFGGDVGWIREILYEAILKLRPSAEVEIGVVVHGQALKDYHDRHLFTRYFEVHASRSVDTLHFKDASLDGCSVLDPAQRPATRALLQKVKAVVDGAKSHPDARISGPTNHPLFALLDEA